MYQTKEEMKKDLEEKLENHFRWCIFKDLFPVCFLYKIKNGEVIIDITGDYKKEYHKKVFPFSNVIMGKRCKRGIYTKMSVLNKNTVLDKVADDIWCNYELFNKFFKYGVIKEGEQL